MLKLGGMSPLIFIVSQVVILVIGLSGLGGLYLYVNNPSPEDFLTAKGPLTKEPTSLTLDVTSPPDDLLTFDKDLLISGKTKPESEILISDSSSDVVVESRVNGSFSYDLILDPGVNHINITLFDKNGDQRQVQKTVFYSKEKI